MSCLCLGPKQSGKSHLLKALQNGHNIDVTSSSVPTVGTSIYMIRFPNPTGNGAEGKSSVDTMANNKNKSRQYTKPNNYVEIMEIGGSIAPLWRRYFSNVNKIIYVVDTSNLCQISAAGILLYSILAEPRLQKTKFLLVLSKMDYAYRQMRNEALLMLQMSKLHKEIRQQMTIVEASAVTKKGFDEIYEWLQAI